MSDNLCHIWSELASYPDNAKAIKEARAHLTQLLEHVDDCETCRGISASMQADAREAVFAALSEGGVTLAKDELAILKTMDQILADDREAIDDGVDVLLAGLPAQLGTPGRIAGGAPVTSLQVFLGIDAVNLLVRSYASRGNGQSVQLSNAGLRIGGTLVSKREAIIGEIGRHASVNAVAAEGLWTWQLSVAELCPTLYRGLEVTNVVNGQLELKVQPSASSTDLLKRWKIQRKEVLVKVEIRQLVGEFFGMVCGWEQAIEPRLGMAMKDVIPADQLFQKVVDQIRVDNQQLVNLMKPLNVAPITYGDRPWAQVQLGEGDRTRIARIVKVAEKQKMSYLNMIAGVEPDATTEINIKPLQQYAVRVLERSDRRIRVLDQYMNSIV